MCEGPGIGEEMKSRLVGLIVAVALAPVYIFFSSIGQSDRGFAFVSMTGVFCSVVYAKFDQMRRAKIVLSLFVFYIVHAIMVLCVELPPRFPGFVMIPLAIVDAVIVLGFIKLVEKSAWARDA